MTTTATQTLAFRPAPADTVEETGLSHALVLDLVLKHAYFEGTATLAILGDRAKLGPPVVHALYRHMQKEQLCETRGMVGHDYEIALTNKGRFMAELALKKSQYTGPAPVTLMDYRRAVTAQAVRLRANVDQLKEIFSDLVLPDSVIKELGASLSTGGTLLLYGSTGNGKTSIAERLHRIFTDLIYVPYAIEVGGQVVTVFDPLIHFPDGEQDAAGDPRWVLCQRPMVKVGGEMEADMLNTRVDDVTRICIGPLQMKANNGILLIDDFGRQRITPRELLNRWIVPLDRRTDMLSLWSGVSFEIPFELLVVFATNLPLTELAEEAFMRRLKNKIKIEPMSHDLFRELIGRVCQKKQIAYTPETEEYILSQCLKRTSEGLRACFPIDLIEIVCGIAAFEQREPELDEKDIDQALNVYFAR